MRRYKNKEFKKRSVVKEISSSGRDLDGSNALALMYMMCATLLTVGIYSKLGFGVTRYTVVASMVHCAAIYTLFQCLYMAYNIIHNIIKNQNNITVSISSDNDIAEISAKRLTRGEVAIGVIAQVITILGALAALGSLSVVMHSLAVGRELSSVFLNSPAFFGALVGVGLLLMIAGCCLSYAVSKLSCEKQRVGMTTFSKSSKDQEETTQILNSENEEIATGIEEVKSNKRLDSSKEAAVIHQVSSESNIPSNDLLCVESLNVRDVLQVQEESSTVTTETIRNTVLLRALTSELPPAAISDMVEDCHNDSSSEMSTVLAIRELTPYVGEQAEFSSLLRPKWQSLVGRVDIGHLFGPSRAHL